MDNRSPITNSVVVAFTTFNPQPDFKEHVRVAALECAHVLVVDDGSTIGFDGFEEEICSASNVTLIWKGENAGIADSVNVALDYAAEMGADYLMLFDQDTIIYDGLISRTVASALDYQRSHDGLLGCLGAGVIHGRPYLATDVTGVAPVPEIIQSGTVFSVSALISIGGANSELIIDGVDTDICLRLREKGYEVVVDGSISIAHPVGSGKSVEVLGYSVLITNHNPARRYYMTRNRVFILTNFRWWKMDFRWCLVYLRRFIVSCVVATMFEEHRFSKVQSIGRGLIDGFRGRLGRRCIK